VLQAELFNPRCLFLFGTYTIGKERLFLHVAAALQRKVRPPGCVCLCRHQFNLWLSLEVATDNLVGLYIATTHTSFAESIPLYCLVVSWCHPCPAGVCCRS
jgi:hypothetical protein